MTTHHVQLHNVQKIDNYNCKQGIIIKEEYKPKQYNFRKIDSVSIDKEPLQDKKSLYQGNLTSPSFGSIHDNYYKNHKRQEFYKNKPYAVDNHFVSEQNLIGCTTSEHYKQDVKNSLKNIDNNIQQQMITAEPQLKKTYISLLNEWSMRGDGSNNKKPIPISYELTAIEGSLHKPKFIYKCQVLNVIALGEGESKKEAKQNSAAQMWSKLFRSGSTANNDKVITSTTTTNNFEMSTPVLNDLTMNLQSMDTNGIEPQKSNFTKVQIEYSIMNPIGALQELSISNQWSPPIYNVQKLQQCNSHNKTLYKVICNIFFLQTEGHGITKQEAKHKSAYFMNQQIHKIGINKLNEIKNSENKIMLPDVINKDGSTKYKESKNEIRNSAQLFRTFFKIAANIAPKDAHDKVVSSNNNSNNRDIETPQGLEVKLEKLITEFNSHTDPAVKQLEFLGQQLGFIISFVTVDQIKIKENDVVQDKKYTVLLQVTTKPVIVTTAIGSSIEEALEEAAKNIIIMMRSMLCATSTQS